MLENACEIICKSRIKYGVGMWCVKVGRKIADRIQGRFYNKLLRNPLEHSKHSCKEKYEKEDAPRYR